jgi:hypothetical protein
VVSPGLLPRGAETSDPDPMLCTTTAIEYSSARVSSGMCPKWVMAMLYIDTSWPPRCQQIGNTRSWQMYTVPQSTSPGIIWCGQSVRGWSATRLATNPPIHRQCRVCKLARCTIIGSEIHGNDGWFDYAQLLPSCPSIQCMTLYVCLSIFDALLLISYQCAALATTCN